MSPHAPSKPVYRATDGGWKLCLYGLRLDVQRKRPFPFTGCWELYDFGELL